MDDASKIKVLEGALAFAERENFALAAWQCMFTDGSGLTGDESGRQICLKAQEVERLRAEVAAVQLLAQDSIADADRLRAENAALRDPTGQAGEDYYRAKLISVETENAALRGIVQQMRTAAQVDDWETFDGLVDEALKEGRAG